MAIIRGVLFDLDQTLVDRTQSLLVFLAWQWDVQKALQVIPKKDFIVKFIQFDDNGNVWKDIVYQKIVDDFNIRDIESSFLLADYLVNFSKHVVLYSNVTRVLTALKNKQIRLGIITNGRTDMQTSVIRDSGLEAYVDVILISEAEGVRKPDKKIFLSALEHLKLEASSCVFVGDNPDADIRGAHGVGMRTIWKRNEFFLEPRPEFTSATFSDFEELYEMINSICGSE